MEDFSDPSFSLGFDFDLPQAPSKPKEKEKPQLAPVQEEFESPSFNLLPDELQIDLDQEFDQESAPVLKRLRRGSAPVPVSSDSRFETPIGGSLKKNESSKGLGFSGSDALSSLEDEIESFSSQEDPFIVKDGHVKNTSFDASSSSKISLRNQGVLTSQSTNKKTQSTNKTKSQKLLQKYFSSTSSNLEKGDKTKLLPKLKLSPLRKFHLLDSDSDLDLDSDFNHNKNKPKILKKAIPSVEIKPKGHPKLATPALDRFCEEYLKSEKDRNAPQKREEGSTSKCSSRVFDPVEFTKDFEDILPKEELSSGISNNNPPCFKYFCHSDARIRNLVRERLSHFTPIGSSLDGRRNEENRNENIDYMAQFGKRETVKGKRVRNGGKKDSTPQDVGKRRVQANSGSGHWFTNENGKKVYVSKNGQELSGQFAYRQYKRDNGGGYRKSKKQGPTRKKGKK